MSTYYYLGCDKCRMSVPFWARWAGGPGVIPTARKWPDTVQDFIEDHRDHGIGVFSEHDEARAGYTSYLPEDENAEYDSDKRPKVPTS